MTHEAQDGQWEHCQIEQDEQAGFFRSRVVYRVVTVDRDGHRKVLETTTVARQPAEAVGGWEPLAERLVASGWEQVPQAAGALPTFRRLLRY